MPLRCRPGGVPDRREVALVWGEEARSERLRVDVHVQPGQLSTLAEDVRCGLTARPKTLPSKHLYDERGSRLFEQICRTPEYYPTRTEDALLIRHADELVRALRPDALVELGSGAARKTRSLLRAAGVLELPLRYVPFDVSEAMLRQSAQRLLAEFPWLGVHGVVGDFERHLDRIPSSRRRLIAFLGGTIGNFLQPEAVAFLGKLRATMGRADRLLIGFDRIKDPAVLHAAYNDAAGWTAAFNRNVLFVINRELGGRFHPLDFEHVAFYAAEREQVEMHLRASRPLVVRIETLELEVSFEEGETIRTEVSRKFSREGVASLFHAAGLELEAWYPSPDDWFALALGRHA